MMQSCLGAVAHCCKLCAAVLRSFFKTQMQVMVTACTGRSVYTMAWCIPNKALGETSNDMTQLQPVCAPADVAPADVAPADAAPADAGQNLLTNDQTF